MKHTHYLRSLYFVALLMLGLASCKQEKSSTNKNIVLHAASSDAQSIGGLSFSLYKDNKYVIMHSGGLGASFHRGSYSLSGDTITLHDFEKQGPLKQSRLLVIRYDEQDSTYWMWKYPDSIRPKTWNGFKSRDHQMGVGDVYQLDENDQIPREMYHFTLALDELSGAKFK